ncbi:DUF4906 domain-containing protein [Bacteroides ihuae]|uniref:DUF4906 domain-containing protein n=1 Tax=Bacteroides ihuae TaxID=1852362 RepID=UPI0008D98B42|nr:DUF4906 domain-containing protein [Bacteroides ihuae]
MMLNKWILPTIGILLLLLTSCSRDDSGNSDSEEGETIQMHFKLQPMKMESVASATTKATSKNEALNVAMGQSGKSTTSTRSSTGIDESVINEVCVFQFGGTLPTSTLVAKEYYSSPNTANLETTLIENSSNQTVYVVANVGDVTGNYTIGTTTIADFQTSTLSFATEASVTSGTDLPMIGSYTGATMPGLYAVSLTRMVAKLDFTCNVNLTNTSDAFTLTSVRLYSVANVAQMNTPTGSYPANSTTDASKYPNYTAESYTAGNTLTWYIPENLRGTVSAITTEQDKSKTNAPAYSTYIEVEGLYTPSGSTTEYVTYRLYPGANMSNDFNITRNTAYSLSMTIKGMNEVDSRVLLPENLSINNAGTQVTANCYIANNANQNYKFKATVMGNGKTTPASTVSFTSETDNFTQSAPAIVPSVLVPTKALLIWETGSAGDVIESGSVKLVGGYVRFKTANNTTNGNALIGVTDGTNILWSWHIWKTPYAPDADNATTYDTYTTRAISTSGYNTLNSRTFRMMKYNLGATVTSNWTVLPTNAGDFGLMYQWGRKDPFLGALSWNNKSELPGADRVLSSYNTEFAWADGTTGTSAIKQSLASISGLSGANASIAYSIQHPTHYIYSDDTGSIKDWLNVITRASQRDNLWGNPNTSSMYPNTANGSKSIYDPCPPEWRLPCSDTFTGFTTSGIGSSNIDEFMISGTFNSGWLFYITSVKSGATSFWPASGYRSAVSGALFGDGMWGYCSYSSSHVSGSGAGGLLHFGETLFAPNTGGGYRSYAFPVRCIEE